MTQYGFPKTTATSRTGTDAEELPVGGKRATTRSARTKVAEIVAVCTRCAKRQGLRPRDVRERLEGAAKRAAKDARPAGGPSRGIKIRIVGTGCLGPCPKRALAVATGASVAAGRVLLLDPAAGEAAMARALLPACRPRASAPVAAREPPATGSGREAAPGLPFAAHSCDDPGSVSSECAPAPVQPDESSPQD